MNVRLFSTRNRPAYLGPYPTERLERVDTVDLLGVPKTTALDFNQTAKPHGIVNAMREYQAMLDAIRDGMVNKARSEIPADPIERAQHLKAFGYFSDASMVGICRIPNAAQLSKPFRNPDIDRLAHDLATRQTKTLASGIDLIMADLKESVEAPPSTITDHTHAIVFLYENPRAPRADEPGAEWILEASAHRGALRANETACVIANYLRLLGWSAKSHSATSSDVCLNHLAMSCGLARLQDGALHAPWIGTDFGLAVVTTNLELATDRPLNPNSQDETGLAWTTGRGSTKSALNRDPFAKRDFKDGPHPFERLKRVDTPTTYIDEPNVPRVPKRADMFARALFGDMGPKLQESAKGGHYVRKAPVSFAQRRALGAFVLIQDGAPAPDGPRPPDAAQNAFSIKAASYFLGVDAVGISRCPEWAWYSHDAAGDPINPTHDNAISMIVDQGFETMEGSSGDDWIAVAQSMRAYLRFSLLGGVIAQQIRNLGYQAKAHTVMDGEVLQPPLLLLSGLGEVSRIGEVILNPYLGPRLKSGVVTTDMPLAHDKPINFGLQNFCQNCNKCARECPSGAITAGPKRMFNGYEIWKSDSQKCATYRISTQGGAMCGRCMKTCPWNLEGLFSEAPFRWMASNIPSLARPLAKLDDKMGRGGLNPVKKWWWDIELEADGAYRPTQTPVNARGLQTDLDLKYEDQTLAVYPAPLAPPPWPYPFPMDREAGIAAYQTMISADAHRKANAEGRTDHLHRYIVPTDAPVIKATVSKVEKMTADVTMYEFQNADGGDLPAWAAGAHLDVVVAPEFLRQYSMSGDPANTSSYQIGVLREDEGRGGSKLMHRIFNEGRRVFISKPIKHFDLDETAKMTLLMAGGIGVTPMIAFAHRLHEIGAAFELHFSARARDDAAYRKMLTEVPWSSQVHYHFSTEGTRADLTGIMARYKPGWHMYTCGPDRYMSAVIEAAEQAGFPDEARHLEYFSVPEQPDYENHAFTLRLTDGRSFNVPADKSATDVLQENGVHIDVKCSDGICGVCKCKLVDGKAEHRDFVLSARQREEAIILCQSRAADPDGEITVELPHP